MTPTGGATPTGSALGSSSGTVGGLRPIKAASLNRLIVMLAPEEKHDIEYMKTFLLTYQSFTKPAKLLQKLIQRYHVPLKPGMTEEEYKKVFDQYYSNIYIVLIHCTDLRGDPTESSECDESMDKRLLVRF